ncbi:DUF1853 family protein [Flavisericum labens]|uniref:DUF1853 family protein n=1 Tax=Flavisericum labens TaxID=3377112 RepID=UPI00387B1999
MDLKQKEIQLQFQGFLNTPFLWEKHDVFGLEQIELHQTPDFIFNEKLSDNLRLGKRVERFVSAELKNNDTIIVYCENVQIQKEKTTLGEMDCILKQEQIPIHLEIVYKFYLYDPTEGNEEIQRWIGPNRNDSLVKKIDKLKNRQLPLLYNQHTKPLLDKLNIKVKEIKQRVYFKAQLFLPYQSDAIIFSALNPDCVKGFYIHFSELKRFSDCKFYIPTKFNWLIEPVSQVDWMNYSLFYENMQVLFEKQNSPLCWIKFKNGEIKKCFIVWWN